MKIKDIFDVSYGINLELNKCEITDDTDGINFVSRTSQNNGIVAKVKRIEGKEPQPAGVLTCAGGGSVLSTFVQTKPFYSGRDLYILTPKNELTLNEKLFYAMCIKENAYRYNYGRQANKTLKDIELPNTIPDWVYDTKINTDNLKNTNNIETNVDLDISKWKYVSLSDIFRVERGKRLTKDDRVEGSIPFVTAGYQNEGITDYISNSSMTLYKDCLTIDMFGNSFYRNYNFYCDDNILLLIPRFYMNKYVLLFISTIISNDKYKFSYGRQYRQKDFNKHSIKLPFKEDSIDFVFIENYMKSLVYGDKI